ncbi:MAG: YCF48-related protein [Ignavibacterium sp.]
MIRIVVIVLLLISSAEITSQQINWKHTGGPMGGIIGDIGINSSGEIYAGVYPDWQIYSGLYKSTDNGDSWFKIETQFDDFEVYAIYITKEDHIWVGTNFQGRIYLSTDNGKTWENKRNGYNTGECWAFGQSKDGVMFAGDGQYAQLYRSTDYGNNWILSANIRPLVFATDSNNIVYCGTHLGLYATSDNGLTWAQNNFLSNIPVSSILIDSNNNIYCGTGYYNNGNGVFYSTDGGENWSQLGLASKIVLSLAFDSEGNLYAGTSKDGLYKTTDMGQNWIQYKEGLYRKDVFRLRINKQDHIFIGSEGSGYGLASGGGGVFRSKDRGRSFEHIGLPISRIKNIAFSGDSLIFTSTPAGVQKYNLRTGKWQNLGLHNVESIAVTPSDYLYAATYDEGLFKSTDLGINWQLTNLTADTIMSVYNLLVINDNVIFASTEFNLRKSIDGGNSWTVLPIATGFSLRGLALRENKLFVTGYKFQNSVLYRSENMGLNFDSVYSGFSLQPENNLLKITDSGILYLGCTGNWGLKRSTDWGNIWQSTSLRNTVSCIYADDSGKVIVSSDSIYISINFGNDWMSQNYPFNQSYFSDIKKIRNKLYWATYNKGLYETDFILNTESYSFQTLQNYFLYQNYPNPFNPSTKICWQSPVSSWQTLKVYDVLGNEVATLVDEYREAGRYEVEFPNVKTGHALSLPSGIYFYRLQVGEFVQTKKMILAK